MISLTAASVSTRELVTQHGVNVETVDRHYVDMGDVVSRRGDVTRHHLVNVHKQCLLGPVSFLDECLQVVALIGGDIQVLHYVQVVLNELGSQGVREAVHSLVVVQHVGVGPGAPGP